MKLADPGTVDRGTPCAHCGTTHGRLVSWAVEGQAGRLVLCRECYYRAEAEGTPVDDLMRDHYFAIRDTAGGCNAYGRDLPGGGWIYVTGFDGDDATNVPTRMDQRIAVGWYTADAECIDQKEYPTLAAALAALDPEGV